MKYSISLILFFLLCSCGKKMSQSATEKIVEQKEQDPLIIEEKIDGQYLARLIPINAHISGALDGSATIAIEKDEFIGDVRLFGNKLTADTSFEQSIHIGDRCPTLADDLNADGIIDELETLAVVKGTLLPLDGDLNAQWLGIGIDPLSDSFGSYYYSQVASFKNLLDDLWEEDINLEDPYLKLIPNEDPVFENRVALIRGIKRDVVLPSTVSSQSRRGVHAGLPLLCGLFQKIKSLPGRRNIDRYPYPHQDGVNPDDGATTDIPQDDTTPDYDIEPSGPITNYGED